MSAPVLAISIRQPYAWAVVAGHKDVENRSASVAGRLRKLAGQEIAIHAAWNMADSEWDEAARWMRQNIGVEPPHPDEMFYGGVIGFATVGAVIEQSRSIWFDGPFGIKLINPRPVDYVKCRGWPGVFRLEQSGIHQGHFARAAARA